MTGTKKERKRASWLYISKEWFYALQQGDYTAGEEVNVKGSSSFRSCSNLDFFFFFWLCQVFFAVLRLSPVVVSGCYSLLIVLACGLLIAVASLVAEHRLQGPWASVVVISGLRSCGTWALACKLSSCSTLAQLPHALWDFRGPGIKPCIGRQILNHWTTREVPIWILT